MKISKNGIAFIEREEGVILYAYDDFNEKKVSKGETAKGTITIGTGHTSAAGLPEVVPGMTITKQEADAILAKDLSKVEDGINKVVKVPLNQNQFDAIVSFDFNTGGFARSTVLKKLNAGDYQGAADALLNWSKANGNPTLLLPRRQRERTLFLSKPQSSMASSGAAAGAVVAGGAAIASTPHHYWPWIIGGTIVTAIVSFLAFEYYEYKKVN